MVGGIVGLYNTRGAKVDPGQIEQMNLLLGHKDVLRKQHEVHPWLQFGQMVWQPEYRSHQTPIYNSEFLTVVGDSKLSNASGLKTILNLRPLATDQEIITNAYLKWGRDCVDHFYGPFAFALWDERKQSLFLARDSQRISPLVYTFQNGIFAFATELKCLLSLDFPKEWNDSFMIDYFDDFFGDSKSTAFSNYFHLSPGHALMIQNGHLEEWCFWQPKGQEKMMLGSDEEYERCTLDLIQNIVQEQFENSQNEVAVFLDGSANSAFWLSLLKNTSSIKSICAISYLLPGEYKGFYSDDRFYIETLRETYNFRLVEVFEPKFENRFGPELEYKMDANDTPGINPIGSDHNVLFPAVRSEGMHWVSSGMFQNFMSWSGRELYRDLLLNRNYRSLFHALRDRNELHGDGFRKLIRSAIPSTLGPKAYRILRQLVKFKFQEETRSILKREISEDVQFLQHREKLKIKGSHPNLHIQNDIVQHFRMLQSFSKKPTSSVMRRYDVGFSGSLSDRRLMDWLIQIPSDQFVKTKRRMPLFYRLCKRQGIPTKILDRTDFNSWPPDWGDRRREVKPFLIQAFDKISEADPIWNWVDRSVAIQMFDQIKRSDDYNLYRSLYADLIKYPLASRYLQFTADKWM